MALSGGFSGISRKVAIAGVMISAVMAIATPPAKAQDIRIVPAVDFTTIPEEFEEAFYVRDPYFYENRTVFRQFNYLFGPFPENDITRASQSVNDTYLRFMSRQLASGYVLRTPDLPTPFTESVLTLPTSQRSIPPAVVIEPPPMVTPVPMQPAQPQAPVPALW